MPVTNPASVHDVDAEVLAERLSEAVTGRLWTLVEFDEESFNVLYAPDETIGMYGSESAMREHFGEIHGFVNLDYMEMDLFTDELFPHSERVRFLASGLDLFTMVRVYVDQCGFFVGVDADEEVLPVVETVEAVVGGD